MESKLAAKRDTTEVHWHVLMPWIVLKVGFVKRNLIVNWGLVISDHADCITLGTTKVPLVNAKEGHSSFSEQLSEEGQSRDKASIPVDIEHDCLWLIHYHTTLSSPVDADVEFVPIIAHFESRLIWPLVVVVRDKLASERPVIPVHWVDLFLWLGCFVWEDLLCLEDPITRWNLDHLYLVWFTEPFLIV